MSDNLFLADEASEQWHDPVPGFELTPAEICIPVEHQTSKLTSCGLDPAVFGRVADPAFFIGIGIHAGIRSGISAQGNINMLQKLIVYRPAELGEVLLVKGEIETVQPVPRGAQISTRIRFEDHAGNLVIDASRTSLRPEPGKSGARGAGERPAPVVANARDTRPLDTHVLTPDQVKAYSLEGNSIHYEETAAKAAGFRAPMIGGGMGVHYLTAALFSRCAPAHIDLDIFFRRPIFWDESFASAVLADDHSEAGNGLPAPDAWRALCLLRDEGAKGLKVLTEARLNELRI